MSRGTVILLMLLSGAGAAAAGYHWFWPLMKFVCVGALPQLVRFHSDASQLARTSFAIAAGIAGASVPFAALMGLHFTKKGKYVRLLGPAFLMMLLAFVAAAFVYRQEMQALGSTTKEVLNLYNDSRRELALNPLTRCALISTAATLGYGLFEWIVNAFRR